MTNLLRSEWIKFRSVRSTLVVLLLAGALVVLIAVLAANDLSDETSGFECRQSTDATGQPIESEPNGFCENGGTMVRTAHVSHLTDITVGVTIAAVLFGVLGVQVIGQEYRFNTIRPTFTAAPHRLRVLVAKLVVVTTACAVVSAVMVAVCWAIGSMMLDDFAVDGVDRRAALGIVLFSMAWSAIGMGVGEILRQPIAAIPILLGEAFVAEGIIGALIDSTLKWLPFSNGIQMTLRNEGDASTELQSVLGGGIYFFVVAAVVWGIGAVLVNRRDA